MENNVTELTALQMRYDLPPSLAKIVVLLIGNHVVTARMIEHEHRITKDAKVAMHRLRRRLEMTGVEIKSRRDVGYWIEPEARASLLEAMKPTKLELPLGDGGSSGAAAAPAVA